MIEQPNVPDEQFFRCSGLLKTSAICHRLTAAILAKRIDHIYAQIFQKLQRGNTHFQIEEVDITFSRVSQIRLFDMTDRALDSDGLLPHPEGALGRHLV